MKGKIRALIVDDEPKPRRRALKLLSADPEIEIVGACANGRDAITAIQAHNPHLVFLDVVMSPIDGFAVLEAIAEEQMPLVIFVTAYEEYFPRAFEVHSVDYLFKPYSNARFEEAVRKAKRKLRTEPRSEITARTNALLEEHGEQYPERLWVKDREHERWLPIKTADIDWIEVNDKHVRLHVGEKFYDRRQPLSDLHTQLNPKQFWLIARWYIVNVERIQQIDILSENKYEVVLRGGKKLAMSRDYRKRLRDLGWDL